MAADTVKTVEQEMAAIRNEILLCHGKPSIDPETLINIASLLILIERRKTAEAVALGKIALNLRRIGSPPS